MQNESVVRKAMRLWLRTKFEHYQTQHNLDLIQVCELVIREWAIAYPDDMPIEDILKEEGVGDQ